MRCGPILTGFILKLVHEPLTLNRHDKRLFFIEKSPAYFV
jgi:hypothetical protein